MGETKYEQELSFKEIKNWKDFEDLVADFFREVKNDNEFDIESVDIKQTGIGSDGGRDILVTFLVYDSIKSFHRTWIVQCKYYNKNVGKSEISSINIPSLIHEYKANGYLIICKEDFTSGLTESFESLNKNCKFNYQYEFWNGTALLNRIRNKEKIIRNYFPKHAAYLDYLKRQIPPSV